MNRKRFSKTKSKVIIVIASGLLAGATRSPRRAGLLLRNIPKQLKDIDRKYLYDILREFKRDRLVDYHEDENGNIDMVLTDKGVQRQLRYNVDLMTIAKPTRWDGKWRVLTFDVPERKRAIRDSLRRKLVELGFLEWQKSVFIHPFASFDDIDFIIEFFEARPYTRRGIMTDIDDEASLKLHFKLT